MTEEDQPPEQPKRALQPLHIGFVVAGVVALILLWLWPRPAPEPEPEPIAISEPPAAIEPEEQTPLPQATAPEQVQIPEPEEPEPEPDIALPSLDDSDQAVKDTLNEPQWQGLGNVLTEDYIIRKTVRAVVAAANGEWVNQHRPINPPVTPFKVTKSGEQLRMAGENFERYTPYVDALVNIEAENAAQMYQQYYPLFQEAYSELGLQQGNFHGAVLKALQTLETTPDLRGAELIQPSVAYKFKDPAIEQLPQIQKLLIRIGPDNQAKLKTWLAELKRELEQATPPAES